MSIRPQGEIPADRHFVLQPCFAVNWPQTVRIFVAICVVCGGIAVAFALLGFWPILPFAGIELAALGTALYVSGRRSLDREVIHITEREVAIEKGRRRPERRWRLARAWTEVVLLPPVHRWREPRLALRSRGELIEVGAFLADAERRSLAQALRRHIGPMAVAAPLALDPEASGETAAAADSPP